MDFQSIVVELKS